jgi:hypothetical protein
VNGATKRATARDVERDDAAVHAVASLAASRIHCRQGREAASDCPAARRSGGLIPPSDSPSSLWIPVRARAFIPSSAGYRLGTVAGAGAGVTPEDQSQSSARWYSGIESPSSSALCCDVGRRM